LTISSLIWSSPSSLTLQFTLAIMMMIIDQTTDEICSSMTKRSGFKIFLKTLKVRRPFRGLKCRVEDNSSVLVSAKNGWIHLAPDCHDILNTLITFSVLGIS
jgi:hypothetical protein